MFDYLCNGLELVQLENWCCLMERWTLHFSRPFFWPNWPFDWSEKERKKKKKEKKKWNNENIFQKIWMWIWMKMCGWSRRHFLSLFRLVGGAPAREYANTRQKHQSKDRFNIVDDIRSRYFFFCFVWGLSKEMRGLEWHVGTDVRTLSRAGRTYTHTHTHSHTHWGAVEAEAEEDVVDERPRPKNACQIDKWQSGRMSESGRASLLIPGILSNFDLSHRRYWNSLKLLRAPWSIPESLQASRGIRKAGISIPMHPGTSWNSWVLLEASWYTLKDLWNSSELLCSIPESLQASRGIRGAGGEASWNTPETPWEMWKEWQAKEKKKRTLKQTNREVITG